MSSAIVQICNEHVVFASKGFCILCVLARTPPPPLVPLPVNHPLMNPTAADSTRAGQTRYVPSLSRLRRSGTTTTASRNALDQPGTSSGAGGSTSVALPSGSMFSYL